MEKENEIANEIDKNVLKNDLNNIHDVIEKKSKGVKSKKEDSIENQLTQLYTDFKLNSREVDRFIRINFKWKHYTELIEVLLIQLRNNMNNMSNFSKYFQIFLFFEANIIEFDSAFKPYYDELISIIESLSDDIVASNDKSKNSEKTDKMKVKLKTKFIDNFLRYFKSFHEAVDIKHILYIDNYVFRELYFKNVAEMPIEKDLWSLYLSKLDEHYPRLNDKEKKAVTEDEKIKLMMQFTNFLKVDIIIDNFVAQVIDFLFSKIKQPSQAEKIQDLETRISQYFAHYHQNLTVINKNFVRKANKKKLLYIVLMLISFFNLDQMNYKINMDNSFSLLMQYLSNDPIYFSYFIEVFYLLRKKLDNPLYVPFELNGSYRKTFPQIFGDNYENFDDYLSEDYHKKYLMLIEFNEESKINIYNGAFLFLRHIIAQSKRTTVIEEKIDLTKYPNLILLQMIKGIVMHPKFMEYQHLIKSNIEIVYCIYQMIESYYQKFTINEWKIALSTIFKIHNGDVELKKIVFYNQFIFNIIKSLYIRNNPTFFEDEDFNEIIAQFLSIEDQPLDERNLDLIKCKLFFLEFCPLYKFKSVLDTCLIPIVNTQFQIEAKKRLSLEDYFLSLILLFDLLSKLLADPEKEQGKKEILEKEVINIFTNFIQTFTKAYNEIIEGEKNENKKDDSQGGTSINKKKIMLNTMMSSFEKLLLNIVLYSNNLENIAVFIKNLATLKYSDENNKEEKKRATQLFSYFTDFQFRVVDKMLIKLNDLKTKDKMSVILDTVIISKEEGKKHLSSLAHKILQNLVIKGIGHIYFLNMKNEIEEQKNPCVLVMTNNEEQNNDKYYLFDINLIMSNMIQTLNEKELRNFKTSFERISKFMDIIYLHYQYINPSNFEQLTKNLVKNDMELMKNFRKNQDNIEIYDKLISLICKSMFITENTGQKEGKYFNDESRENIFENYSNKIINFHTKFDAKECIIKTTASKSNDNYLFISEIKKAFVVLSLVLASHDKDGKNTKTSFPSFVRCMETIIKCLLDSVNAQKIKEFPEEYAFMILLIIYVFKEQLSKCSDLLILKCLYITMSIGFPAYYIKINRIFNSFFLDKKVQLYSLKLPEFKINCNNREFFNCICDINCFYLLSALTINYQMVTNNKKLENRTLLQMNHDNNLIENILAQFKGIKEKRIILFQEMCYNILNIRNKDRSSMNENAFKENIEQYKIYLGEKEGICIKKEEEKYEIVVINSVSQNLFNLHFKESKYYNKKEQENMITQLINKENVNDMNIEKKLKPYKDDPMKPSLPLMIFYKNAKKPKESTEQLFKAYYTRMDKNDKQKLDSLKSMLSVPIYYERYINVFYLEETAKELSLDNLFKSKTTSTRYLKFLSLLGSIYEKEKDNYTLEYHDDLYNLIFNLCDLKPTPEEKHNLFSLSKINIIWIENREFFVDNTPNIFPPDENGDSPITIFIIPLDDDHYLIKKQYHLDKDSYLLTVVENIFANDYIINSQCYGGIKYFINNLIILCEWFYYHHVKSENYIKPSLNKEQNRITPNPNRDSSTERSSNSIGQTSIKSKYNDGYINNNLSQRYDIIQSICSSIAINN